MENTFDPPETSTPHTQIIYIPYQNRQDRAHVAVETPDGIDEVLTPPIATRSSSWMLWTSSFRRAEVYSRSWGKESESAIRYKDADESATPSFDMDDEHDSYSHLGETSNFYIDDCQADNSQKTSRSRASSDGTVTTERCLQGRKSPCRASLADYTHKSELEEPLLLPPSGQAQFGQSSFAQTIFNAVNILIGIGVLSLPYAFKLSGWVLSSTLLIIFGLLTKHTAQLLARCMDSRTGLVTYADIGSAALGNVGRVFISFLFVTELFAASVALVILTSDSVYCLYPELNPLHIKLASFFFLTPLTYPKSLKVFSLGSIIGIFSILNLIVIIIYDGFSTPHRGNYGGSLMEPAVTRLWPSSFSHFSVSIGLLMSGFAGHACFPSLYRDMKNPRNYPRMVNLSYAFTFAVYFLVAICGYLMFGVATRQEITQNLPSIDSYNAILTKITIYFIAINPVTKFPLTIAPFAVASEIWISQRAGLVPGWMLRVMTRTVLCIAVVFTAIIFPEFHRLMGVLGSFFSITVSIIAPIVFFLRLFGHEVSTSKKCMYWTLIILSGAMAIAGTIGSLGGL